MPAKITKEIIESYQMCPYKGYMQLAGNRGNTSDYETLVRNSQTQARTDVAAKMLHDKMHDFLRDADVTFEVLTRGIYLLLDVTHEDEQLKINFDGLQKSTGSSRLGDFHYIPILVHAGEKLGKEQRDLLEVLGLVLGAVQGKQPRWGIFFQGEDRKLRKVKLGGSIVKAQRTLRQIKEMREADTPPKLRLNSHCQICEFRLRCHAKATATDDLSLLRGMGEKEISKYNRRGIFTVTQLSCTFRPKRRAHGPKQQHQSHQHALQALAIRDKKIYILGSPELLNSAVRIFFDVEGDPERGFDYLLGMIVEAGGVEMRYSFWADSPADEARVFQQFLDVVSAHQDFCLYSYGSYESTFLRRMMKSSDREELVKKVLMRTVNVLSIIYAHVYFPTYSNGLKEIGKYLGVDWSETDASGIQSIVWRRTWEQARSTGLKEKLVTYNTEDCTALKKVTHFLHAICPSRPPTLRAEETLSYDGYQVSRVEQIDPQFSRRTWCKANFAIPDFEFVNQRGYFDYQRDKVVIRTNTARKRRKALQISRKRRKCLRINRHVEVTCQQCPSCGGRELNSRRNLCLVRLVYDLFFTPSGIRRWVTRYTTARYRCGKCKKDFLPENYLRLDEHGHAIKSWAMYMHVAHRMSFNGIAETLNDCFRLPLHTSHIWAWKPALARYYEATYRRLLEKIVAGPLIHADETDVHVTRAGKGYVWVFASLREVVFMYRQSREGSFLSELLKGFRGVLVSDFYGVYDSIDCAQQKCLIHLMRDLNHDLLGNPWDEEFKDLASQFGTLLRTIVATVDRYGLRRRHLDKHHRDVDKFYAAISKQDGRSELAEAYRARLVKWRSKLFTFLDHDDVPWNNNNAEHAVKRFAKYRGLADGKYGEAGLKQYLMMLSIYVTCEYKRLDFLKFLLSRETDMDTPFQDGIKGTPSPRLEVYPDGVACGDRGRKETWERETLRK